MCVSPATLNLRAARQLEWESIHPEKEDEIPSTWTGLGLPVGYKEESEDAVGVSTYANAQEPLVYHNSHEHQLTAQMDHQMRRLQLVCSRIIFPS